MKIEELNKNNKLEFSYFHDHWRYSKFLDKNGRCGTAAIADASHAQLTRFEAVHEMRYDSGTWHAEWVTDADSAAINVHFLQIEAKLLHVGENHHADMRREKIRKLKID